MSKINENHVEEFGIELLEKQGYKYYNGYDIAPDGKNSLRNSFEDVLVREWLENALRKLNPKVSPVILNEAIKKLQNISSPDMVVNNETFHNYLTRGIKIDYNDNGNRRGEIVKLMDFDNSKNNDFVVVNQFTVKGERENKRPDIIIFINGLPLVVIELKNPADKDATVVSAFKQLETYKATIPELFTYNGFMVISDGLEAKAGSLSAGFNRFMRWRSADGKMEASNLVSQLEVLIKGMLNKATLVDLLRYFIVFEEESSQDKKGGIKTIKKVKKLAGYHQYYAVNLAVKSTLRASGYLNRKQPGLSGESPIHYGLKDAKIQQEGDRRGGVVWHTQGSGKSLSMVFYAAKLIQVMDNPTIVVITDRNDLDDQLFGTFGNSTQLLIEKPVQVKNREDLKKKLKVASGGIVFTTIHKFQPEEGNVYETLSKRENIVVIADEAHRTQYGFEAKNKDVKENGKVIGKKTVYGFAKYLRDALPNTTYLGFTGTPIEKTDINTPAVFGNYVDVYDINQAVEDGATVKIFYESRLAKINLTEEGKELIEDLDRELEVDQMDATEQAKVKWTKLEALVGSKERLKKLAKDIVEHFEKRQEIIDGKGMIVCMSRRIAVELYKEIIKLKKGWHSDDLMKGEIKVVMTSSSSDGPELAKHNTTKDQRKKLALRMKDQDDELKLVIVCDMWLTGFDVPSLHTLYIDKPMKGHNLMQAIARVNRVYRDKDGGLVVDYLGIASDLKRALSFYTENGGKGDPVITQEKAVQLMLEKLEVVCQMFHGYPYEDYFDADTGRKLAIILEAEDHIIGLEKGKERFVNNVAALSKAFAIAIPHEEAMDVKEEVAFFQAVKARLIKFDLRTGRTSEEMETAIKQVIDKALTTGEVIDVFDAAGLKKPDISILSDEFLQEVKDMKHKNLALEVLKKLLNDEIRGRIRTNYIQSKSLMEMLEDSIRRYHNKILTAVEVIEELIKLGKEIKDLGKEAKELGLTDFEYAFYTAVANNESAKDLMGKDKLRELAVVLFEKIRENASIDWTIKESVRAKLKVIVKRTLRRFGYPPDMQKLATDIVLKQAELIAEEIVD